MPDANTVAKMVLNDWQRGKILYFVKPPEVSVHGSLVVGWGRGGGNLGVAWGVTFH